MALAAIIMFAEEQKISKTTKSAYKLTKSLQGTLEKCSHLEKTLGTAIKRKELCYLGVCDAFTSGDSSAAILEISTPLLAVPAPSLQSIFKAASTWKKKGRTW